MKRYFKKYRSLIWFCIVAMAFTSLPILVILYSPERRIDTLAEKLPTLTSEESSALEVMKSAERVCKLIDSSRWRFWDCLKIAATSLSDQNSSAELTLLEGKIRACREQWNLPSETNKQDACVMKVIGLEQNDSPWSPLESL